MHAAPLCAAALSRPQSEEEDEDEDYSPDEDDFKKTIMVGSEFQAVIPEELCKYGDALPYENDDKLVWDPSKLAEHDVVVYQQRSTLLGTGNTSSSAPPPPQPHVTAYQSSGSNTSGTSAAVAESNAAKAAAAATSPGNAATAYHALAAAATAAASQVTALPIGAHLRDDEQKLYLLLQCGHNVDEALRRRRINATIADGTPSMSQWSEDECRNFENGLRVYGKDFHTVQQLKVKTRSVGELVQFYYLWKKTERHDVFANKARLDKKKYSLHPGLTDYMDRFLEEQECNGGNGGNGAAAGAQQSGSGGGGANGGGGGGMQMSGNGYGTGIGIRERSSSPNVNNCLMYSSYRRQRNNAAAAAAAAAAADPLAIGSGGGGGSGGTPIMATFNLKPKDFVSIHSSKL